MNTSSEFLTVSDLRATLNTALPLGFGYIGTMLIGMTDIILLGRLGADALAAAGLALSLCNILMLFGWGMLFPMMVLVSRRCGAECPRSRIPFKIIRQGLWLSAILSLPAGIILWNTVSILMLTGQDPVLARMAGQYMDYYLWSLFPLFGRAAFAMALVAMHRTGIIALVTWLEVGINGILDYGLIFGKFGLPAMGMAGARGWQASSSMVSGSRCFFSAFSVFSDSSER
uniref:MatE protein n=1 Tax=Candidatus Kentrum sp. DK TaxID=2126562 RepID=A0A450RV41_9GAMM|nr:MAG: MatE protein [Candidatus Kentron sp. DK]